jgi:hypothetical protein
MIGVDRLFKHHYSGIVMGTEKIRYIMYGLLDNVVRKINLDNGIFVSLNSQLPDRQVFIHYFRLTNSTINIDKLKVTSRILEEL